MKHALILHGTNDHPEKNWLPWLRQELEQSGYIVWSPQLPGCDRPNIKRYTEFLLGNPDFIFGEETILIGHSSGAVGVLGLLQALPETSTVDTCYLVGAFKGDLGWESLKELYQPPLDFEIIKQKAKRFVFIHSDNDPFCPLDHAEYLSAQVNGELIVLKDQQHFTIGTAGPSYSQFPFLFELIVQNYPVPFYGNTSDNTHCFQAAIKMVAKKYFPTEEYAWEELDRLTAKQEGLWTWPTAGLLCLQEKGLEVRDIEVFDFPRFVAKGESYLHEFLGEEVATEQIKWSNIPQEQKLLADALNKLTIEQKIPTAADIRALLSDGYIIMCNINAMALDNQPGYVGHFVIIFEATETELIFHDPGLPAMPNKIVSEADFEKAWAYPNEKAKSIMAFRKSRN